MTATLPILHTDFNALTLPRAQPDPDLWIMQVPVLNVSHLPQETFKRLEELNPNGWLGSPGGLGALLRIYEQTDDPALDLVFSYLTARSFDYVRFDPAGEKVADLPVFNW